MIVPSAIGRLKMDLPERKSIPRHPDQSEGCWHENCIYGIQRTNLVTTDQFQNKKKEIDIQHGKRRIRL